MRRLCPACKVPDERPDVLISDLVMPEVDGYETLAALRSEGSCALMPVIVLTGESGPEVEHPSMRTCSSGAYAASSPASCAWSADGAAPGMSLPSIA